ncbi:MAG: tyrosine-type recombinase/integrase [Dehalococcoidia bacterium]|nr:tyrosine-type recombinase/integrase [Dehalococcoidia bacterium]
MRQNPTALIEQDAGVRVNISPFRRFLKAKNRAPKTVQTYVEAVERLDDFLAAQGMPRNVSTITREHVESFIGHLLDTAAAATAANRYRSLQQFFKYLAEDGEIKDSPMARMTPPKLPDGETLVLREDDLRHLIAACVGADFEARRDAAIIRLMIDTGCRIGEALALRLTNDDDNDVDLDQGTIRLLGKGRRWRTASIGAKTARALDRYLRVRREHPDAPARALWLGRRGPLTDQGLRLVIRRRGEQAGLGRIHPHMLRHAAAHHWLAAGGSEGDLMRLLGWTSRDMLQRYAATTGTERAVSAHKRMGLGDRL